MAEPDSQPTNSAPLEAEVVETRRRRDPLREMLDNRWLMLGLLFGADDDLGRAGAVGIADQTKLAAAPSYDALGQAQSRRNFRVGFALIEQALQFGRVEILTHSPALLSIRF